MKIIILSIIICSAVYEQCKPPFEKNVSFNNWAECMRAGTQDTLALYNIMGDDYINTNRVYIKFRCREKIIEQDKET